MNPRLIFQTVFIGLLSLLWITLLPSLTMAQLFKQNSTGNIHAGKDSTVIVLQGVQFDLADPEELERFIQHFTKMNPEILAQVTEVLGDLQEIREGMLTSKDFEDRIKQLEEAINQKKGSQIDSSERKALVEKLRKKQQMLADAQKRENNHINQLATLVRLLENTRQNGNKFLEELRTIRKNNEELRGEIKKLKSGQFDDKLWKETLDKAELALKENQHWLYLEILGEFSEKREKEAEKLNNEIAESYYLSASKRFALLDYPAAFADISKSVRFSPENPKYLARFLSYGLEMAAYDDVIHYGRLYQKLIDSPTNQAYVYNNLGLAYQSKGNYDKAISFYQKAVDIGLETFGDRHTNVAARYNNLGFAYESKGEHDKAITFYQKALNIFEEKLGKEHPSTKIVSKNLLHLKILQLIESENKESKE